MTGGNKPKLEAFVKSWYKLPSNQTFSLIDSNSVDSACYRKLIFRASVPTPLLVLYLAPDGKHLVTNVMDLDIDPVVAQRKKQEELHALLSDGALLTSGSSAAPQNWSSSPIFNARTANDSPASSMN